MRSIDRAARAYQAFIHEAGEQTKGIIQSAPRGERERERAREREIERERERERENSGGYCPQNSVSLL